MPLFERLAAIGFDLDFTSHADAILEHDFPAAVSEIEDVLLPLRINVSELIQSGGGEAGITQGLRRGFVNAGWDKQVFNVQKYINGVVRESETQTHIIDHGKRFENGTLLLEIEWNNKDTFYDRDLENFRRLHSDGITSVGVILTRGNSLQTALVPSISEYFGRHGITSGSELMALGAKKRTDRQDAEVARRAAGGVSPQEALALQFVADKFGQATTHWEKLQQRRRRGVGNPCPVVMIGIPAQVLVQD